MQNFRIRDFLVAFIISLTMILAGFTPVADFLRSKSGTVIIPLQYAFYSFGSDVSSQIDFLRTVKNLDTTNSLLVREVDNLRSELTELKELRRQNASLREQLGVESDKNRVLVLAQVVGRGTEDQLLLKINKGREDGVGEGNTVIVANFLVGKVVEVSDRFSFVRPVTDASLKIAALDQDSEQRARGIVSGQYSRLMIMERILAEEEVEVGDTIITSGEDGEFEAGIIIGKVTNIPEQTEGILKSATLIPGVDLDKIEEVFVIIGDN